MSKNWDRKWIRQAIAVCDGSKDKGTRVGAILVDPESQARVSDGFNGFPRGVDDEVKERHERPEKYVWTVHAERNAIYNAARLGHRVFGCTLYLNWHPLWICETCAGAIIQAGVKRVVGPPLKTPSGRDSSVRYDITETMFREAGVAVEVINMLEPAGQSQMEFMDHGAEGNLGEEIERRIPVGEGGSLVECECFKVGVSRCPKHRQDKGVKWPNQIKDQS